MRNDANINGQISADLRRRGLYIGDFNELIAILVITNEEILITRNINIITVHHRSHYRPGNYKNKQILQYFNIEFVIDNFYNV